MNRAELISRATEAMRNTACSHRGEPDHPDVDGWGLCEVCDATAVLDVILPQVATAEELEALLRTTAEAGEPSVVIEGTRPFILTEDEYGDWWAHSYQREDEPSTWRRVDDLTLPLTVVWRPEP